MKVNTLLTRLKNINKLKLIGLITIGIFILMLLFVYLVGYSFQQKHKDDEVKIGTSFSVKYAQELGVDWHQNFLGLLDDLKIRNFRLMSYWDQIEPEPEKFDFTDLDWQMDEAAKRGAKVSLAIGQRQPRWPECHIPIWANPLDRKNYEESLLNSLRVVVNRYKNHPALESYQLENEARNKLFGDCHPFNIDLFKREVELIKSLDNINPMIINASNQMGIPLKQPVGDKTGFSLYKRAYFEAFGKTWAWNYWYVPSWWHSYRAGLVEWLHNSKAFVHELQAEPWGPEATKNLTTDEQYQTMDTAKLDEIIDYSLTSGMKEVYLWGSEWWYWRLTEYNDPSMWNELRYQVNQNR